VIYIDSDDAWIKTELGEAGAISKMAIIKPSEPITESQMQWMPLSSV